MKCIFNLLTLALLSGTALATPVISSTTSDLDLVLPDGASVSVNTNGTASEEDLKVTCETTGGSPWLGDCRWAVHLLLNEDGLCIQGENYRGSRYGCTRFMQSSTCALSLCADTSTVMACRDVANNAKRVINECNWGNKIGGKIEGYNRNIYVYHT